MSDLGRSAMSGEHTVSERLDKLEQRAVEVIARTYDVREGDVTERFWIQKGIEGMRCAVAECLRDGGTVGC